MAVGTPVAGTVAGSNGSQLDPAYPASTVADNIVCLFAVFHTSTTPVPTAINWPADFTEGDLQITKDASGNATGVAGFAWRRATGALSGTVPVTCDAITAGASSGGLAIQVRIPGCVTTGDPWEDLQVNAPNYTATVTRPAATMSRSAGGMSLLVHLNTDNINIANPAGWTALASNASSQGRDSASDIDYQIPGATGTLSPASGTQTSANATGWVIWHFIFTDTAGGPTTVSGATSLTVTLGATTAAQRTVFAAAATPIVLGAATAGARKVTAAASSTVTFGAATEGIRKVTGQAATPIVLGATTTAVHTAIAATSLPIVLGITTTPATVTVRGATSLTVTLSAATAAVRTAYGATVLPLVLGVTTTPATGAVRGASSLTVTFGATTTPGAVTRIGAATLPVSFGATTTAIRTTYAAAATPLILTVDTAGVRYAYGSLVLPIVLGVTTVVAGDAPIVADLTIGATDEGPTVVVLDGDGLAVVETALHTQLVAEAGVTLVEITDT